MLLAVSTDGQKKKRQRETNVACVNSSGLVQQEALFCSLVHPLCVCSSSNFGHCFVLIPTRKTNFSVVLPASHVNLQHIHKLTNPRRPRLHPPPRVLAPQYIFCRLGSTASLRKENTRRIPDLFPRLPLVK